MATVSRVVVLLLVIAVAAMAFAAADSGASSSPSQPTLVQVLVSKGVLTPQEAAALTAAGNSEQQLVELLIKKGVLTAADVHGMQTPSLGPSTLPVKASTARTTASYKPAVLVGEAPASPPQAASTSKPPAVIPAVAPLRVLQLEPTKPGGLIPDIKLGTKANMKLYGLLKASAIYDSSAPFGTDMPLPGLAGTDTGPDGGREFHLKARFARVGANFEFPDLSPNVVLTGKLEADFEGNFTRVLNRNISTIRSSQFSIRLAWGRVDYKFNENTNFFALFGQDWTPFGSSTLPNLYETTGLGLGFGTLYERAPQFRFGFGHKVGGSRNVFIQPEFAVVLSAFGDNPASVDNQLGYGERQGADSARPDISGRLVTQWQLDKASGVAPAQLIFSFVQGRRSAEVPVGNIPTPELKALFPNGVETGSNRWGWTGEVQLPTRYVTFLAKYWRGGDLRWYFVGNLQSAFNDVPVTPPAGTTITFVPTVDGSCPAAVAAAARTPGCVALVTTASGTTVAPQQPFRDQGGFVNLGFPLGRIFHADPADRNAGLQLYLHYAYDELFTQDVRRFGNLPNRNDLAAATLSYKLNSLVSFTFEQSMYRTRTVSGLGIPGFAPPLFRGVPARSWHDIRSEVGTTFSF